MKRCRSCRRTEPEARFSGLATALCIDCRLARAAQRRAKPKRPRRGTRRDPQHLAWIRTLACAVPGCATGAARHAHHVRTGTDGGTALKPSDAHAVPLCGPHHHELHTAGQRTFEARHRLDLAGLARALAATPAALRDSL